MPEWEHYAELRVGVAGLHYCSYFLSGDATVKDILEREYYCELRKRVGA
jgi:hypothetical protein